MTRDNEAALADMLAEELAAMKAEVKAYAESLVAAKAIPPFMPPPIWTEGRHGAGTVVRAHGGLFLARRDTEAEPSTDESWLPLVVGLAGVDAHWTDDHRFVFRARLSDGRMVETEREIAVPIVRGYWEPEATYMPGDRVFRFGEWHCTKMSLGVDPTGESATGHWEKVGGKHARDLSFKLDEATGELTENGRAVGNVRKIFAAAVAEALSKQAA